MGQAYQYGFLQTFPDSKRIPLLAILTHSDFPECRDFRSQMAYIEEPLEQYPGHSSITQRDLAGVLSSCHGSIYWQIHRIRVTPRPIGRPKLLTPGVHEMVLQLVRESFEQKEPGTIKILGRTISLWFF
jgi:hypothetical protein